MARYDNPPPHLGGFTLAPKAVNPLEVGQWIRWIPATGERVFQGQVVKVSGPSAVVNWLGGEDQVFPVVEGYFPPYGTGIEVIAPPKGAIAIERAVHEGRMTVGRAAARLGTSRKRVRAMLRAGQLRGRQEAGRWVEVFLDE